MNMRRLEGDPDVMKFTPFRVPLPYEKSVERLAALVARESADAPLGVWAADEKSSGEFVGWFMLMMTGFEGPELGFMLVCDHWGKGYASEAASRLIEYATSDLGHAAVFAVTDPTNQISERVLKKVGFALTGEITRRDRHLGEEMRLNVFAFSRR